MHRFSAPAMWLKCTFHKFYFFPKVHQNSFGGFLRTRFKITPWMTNSLSFMSSTRHPFYPWLKRTAKVGKCNYKKDGNNGNLFLNKAREPCIGLPSSGVLMTNDQE